MRRIHPRPDPVEVETPKLVPLLDAVAPYRGVSVRTLRSCIDRGQLPATKIGRNLYVDPADVAKLFAPKVQPPRERGKRETPTERIERQLAAAGVVAK